MKKILLSTIVLTAFALSTILFQMSCKKEAKADTTTPTTTVNQQNKLLFTKDNSSGVSSIWVANYDGSDAKILNVILPTGVALDGGLALSPDHKTIFFSVYHPGLSQEDDTYSCPIDGGNAKLVISKSYEPLPY